MPQIYRVAELFVSINGEGTQSGKLAVFVRFAGCNLACDFCDTAWANAADCPVEELSGEEICRRVFASGIHRVTLTGGEPLLQPGILSLIGTLLQNPLISVEIETNGSVPVKPVMDMISEMRIHDQKKASKEVYDQESISRRLYITMDYKLPGSGMQACMIPGNFSFLRFWDTVKFVAGSVKDMDEALHIIDTYQLAGRCNLYLSPVFGKIDPADMVDYMKEHRRNDITLQLQMHKYIWEPEQKGV